MSDGYISGDVAARLLGVSPRDLDELVKDGVIPRSGQDKYVLVSVVRSFIDYLQKKVEGTETLGQSELSRRLDMSERNLRDVLNTLGLDHKKTPASHITIAYIRDLREKASGRVQSDARERRDAAQAVEAEVNAQLKMRELYRQDGLILDYDSVHQLFMDWTAVAKNELTRAVNGVVNAIESKHGISVERDIPQSAIDAARTAIGAHADKLPAPGSSDQGGMDTAT